MEMAQSVGTPGGEREMQLLQPSAAQSSAGSVVSGARTKVLRATVAVAVFTRLGVKT